jgi:hypothetical protein
MLFHRPIPMKYVLGVDISDLSKEVQVDGKCYKYRVEDSKCDLPSQ